MAPKARRMGRSKKKAETSIEVYALNRRILAKGREIILNHINRHISEIANLANELREAEVHGDAYRAERLDRMLKERLETLRKDKDPGKPYSLMAEQAIDNFLSREWWHT